MSLILDGTAGVTGPATKVIVGTTTNDSATGGYAGEYVESIVGPVNFPTSSQYGDMTSISLTAGDWDVSATALAATGGATMVAWSLGISTTSGNSQTGLVVASNWMANVIPASATANQVTAIPNYRVSLSGTTTVYLKFEANFSVSTPAAYGRISARRVR